MLDRLAQQFQVSTTVVALVLTLVALQVGLQVYALVDLARRDAVRGGKKWVWALVVVLGGLLGAIGYIVAGRPPKEVDISGTSSGANAAGGEATRRAVDVLYNSRDQR